MSDSLLEGVVRAGILGADTPSRLLKSIRIRWMEVDGAIRGLTGQ